VHQDVIFQKLLKSVDFSQSYSKNKMGDKNEAFIFLSTFTQRSTDIVAGLSISMLSK